MIESLARVPVEVDYASEWRYREPIVDKDVIIDPLSRSLARPLTQLRAPRSKK